MNEDDEPIEFRRDGRLLGPDAPKADVTWRRAGCRCRVLRGWRTPDGWQILGDGVSLFRVSSQPAVHSVRTRALLPLEVHEWEGETLPQSARCRHGRIDLTRESLVDGVRRWSAARRAVTVTLTA